MRVLRVGVIRCAILSCVDVFEVSNMLILLLPTTPLLFIRCEIDEGDSIEEEGVKALHIDSTVMAAINSGSNVVIFVKERVVLILLWPPIVSRRVIYI